jgi:phenylpyruvate tautomerase PptA (4-oxalocrotonate tautomerase family)
LFAGKQAILVIVDSVDQNELFIADEYFASHRHRPAFILANGRNRLSYQPEK